MPNPAKPRSRISFRSAPLVELRPPRLSDVDHAPPVVDTWSVEPQEARMTVGELIEALKQYPPHFRVSLCQVISVGGGAGFDEVLDSPIIGAAGHPAGDVRLVTTRDGHVSSLGPLHRFPSDPSPA